MTAVSTNAHRRMLAEIYADAEDHGIGTWVPVFEAQPDKLDQAHAFVVSRTRLLAGRRLTAADVARPDPTDAAADEGALVLYRAVLQASASLLIPGASVTHHAIGVAAWMHLTAEQRRDTLPGVLACYVDRVLAQERERAHQAVADSPAVGSCLEAGDAASAWDAAVGESVLAPAEDEAVIDRGVLRRLLEELDLLRRRSAPAPDAV